MTDPFAHHGIEHLSPSSVNLFIAEPAQWVLQYVYGQRSPSSAAASRGSATETGVEYGLFFPEIPVQDCIDLALVDFDRRMLLSRDEKRDQEREAIPGLVEQALPHLRRYGVPEPPPPLASDDKRDRAQHKITLQVEGIEVPIEGYLDFKWPDHGILVDLKTQLRLASKMSSAHLRQGATYAQAHHNYEARFAYCTPKKIAVYPMTPEQVAEGWAEMCNVARRIRRFLSVSQDKAELAGIVAPNYDTFYWNDGVSRNAGRQLYGY